MIKLTTIGILTILTLTFGAHTQEINSQINGLALSNDEPIQIESDSLDIDDKKSRAVFSGNVRVLQGDTLLQTKKMIVTYTRGGSITSGAADIETIEVSGRVLLRSDTQTATGENGIFHLVNDTLVLSGSPNNEVVLTEGDNVFTGCKLTVRMESGQARLERCKGGRVNIQIEPKSK